MKSKITISLCSLLSVIILVSGCTQQIQGGGEVSSPAALPVGPIIFTNQTVNTQAEAESIFMEYKQEMWNSQNKSTEPLFENMIVSPYTGSYSSGNGGQFTCNFGTIKFVAELPSVNSGDDWKVENGKVVIRGCKSNIATPVGETPTCSSEDTVWLPALVYTFWINDKGVIFAPGYACTPFEIQESASPAYVTIGKEANITITVTSKFDLDDYAFNLDVPSEIELVSGYQVFVKNLKQGEPVELSWRIKGLQVGDYEMKLKGTLLNAVQIIRVEQEPVGTPIGT
jgi:hypothetical protein